MDFVDRITALANRLPQLLPRLETEEATKNALIMPMLQALGYDVFNPLEVVPEFTADVGTKKGEKVDYAIMQEDQPIILIECKKAGTDLERVAASQLYRYFSVTKARVGIVTDGVAYHFFSDLEEPNKMDSRPFMVFDLRSFDDAMIIELKRFTKNGFDLDSMLSAAVELKYTRAIKKILAEELHTPSEDFVRFFGGKVYNGRMTQSVKEQFTGIVRRAFHGFINDRISDRFKQALGNSEREEEEATGNDSEAELPSGVISMEGDIVTTQEEMDGFLIVKAIVSEVIDVSRVAMRDTKSYCGILLDDNNRKPICRLHFNGKSKKYLGVFDQEKKETRIPIDKPDEIYSHADRIKEVVTHYVSSEA